MQMTEYKAGPRQRQPTHPGAIVKRELEALIRARLVVDLGDDRGRRFHATAANSGGTSGGTSGPYSGASAMPPAAVTVQVPPGDPYYVGGSREADREAPEEEASALAVIDERLGIKADR